MGEARHYCLILLALLVFGALGQEAGTEKQLRFDVVSIKPHGSGIASQFHPLAKSPIANPTLFAARNYSLSLLMMRAYGVEEYQVAGAPWVSTEGYDLDARTETATTETDMMLMLRTLLADRFQLKFHRETRPVLLNVLNVSKDGPKFGPNFHFVKDDEPPSTPGKPVVDQIPFHKVTFRTFIYYLRLNLMNDPLTGTVVPLDDVPPVLDQTGLSGFYDLTLDRSSHESWPAILERQFGLKLEQRKVPTVVFVVDSAVRPAAN